MGFKKGHIMNRQTIFPIITVVLFIVLVGISAFRLFYDVRVGTDQIIAQEVKQLVDVLKTIDKTCKIIDFDYQKNPINFLNVQKFTGSEVGPMNLAYPKKWAGPYLLDNPTIQQKEYMVVRTKQGYFVTPGEGVRLGNGKVVGKDIVLDEDAKIPALMRDPNGLQSEGKALAAPLHVGMSPVQNVIMENLMRAEDGLVLRDEKTGICLSTEL